MDGLPTPLGFRKVQDQFREWTQDRTVPTLGTNAGAKLLPFQTWHRFKEAFAPELVERAIAESPIPVRHLLDPFGGSGTSALSSQFLGVPSTSIEVNPFLADVIIAKTSRYDSSALIRDLGQVVRKSQRSTGTLERFLTCPPTFIEPGVKSRYLFNANVAECLSRIQNGIESLDNPQHQLLFRVILGGILVSVSNAVISGKGRRYRRDWQNRPTMPDAVLTAFVENTSRAIKEIHTHSHRPNVEATVLNGDSRALISQCPNSDLIVFSPPYPNSFDYTDVYNVELWMLGYLNEGKDNRNLRHSTLSSHVQIRREFDHAPQGSQLLSSTLDQLNSNKNALWSQWIPEMVGGYFSDMGKILTGCASRLNKGGQVWMVVGDSQYAGVSIAVDRILMELAPQWGLAPISREPFRSMRSSAQQGGRHELAETLVILAKP